MRSRAACMRSAGAFTVLPARIKRRRMAFTVYRTRSMRPRLALDPIVRRMNATELRDRRIGSGHDQPPLLNGDEHAGARTKAALLQPATGHAEMRDGHSA